MEDIYIEMLDWTYREIPDEAPLHIQTTLDAYTLWVDQFDDEEIEAP